MDTFFDRLGKSSSFSQVFRKQINVYTPSCCQLCCFVFLKWIFERNTKSVFEKYTSIQNIVEVAVMTSLWCLSEVENISLTLCPVFGCHFVFLKSVLEKYTFSVVSSVALRPSRLSDKLQVFASLRKPSIKMSFYIQINEWIGGYKLYTIYYTIRKQKGHKSGIK